MRLLTLNSQQYSQHTLNHPGLANLTLWPEGNNGLNLEKHSIDWWEDGVVFEINSDNNKYETLDRQ